MASSIVNSDHIDESECDFKEYYSRDKTLELRDIYIP